MGTFKEIAMQRLVTVSVGVRFGFGLGSHLFVPAEGWRVAIHGIAGVQF